MADITPKANAELLACFSRVARLKQTLDRLRGEVHLMACELKQAVENFQKACPHEKIVECDDGMLGSCVCEYGTAHPARLCELCGAYEDQCPQVSEGYFILGETGRAIRSVSLAEFMELHNKHVQQSV